MNRDRLTRFSALLLASALALGGVACSSDDKSSDGSTTTTTEKASDDEPKVETVAFDDWVDEVNAACGDFQDAGDDLDDPSGPDEYEDWLIDAGAIFGDLASAIEDAGTPDEMADEAEQYLELLTEAQGLFESAAELAADGEDEDAIGEELSGIDDLSSDADELAADLGIDDCIDEDSDDSSSDDSSSDDTSSDDSSITGFDEEQLIGIYEDAGFTTDEAECIVDEINTLLDDGDLAGLDELDEATGAQIAASCLTPERLTEMGTSGGF